MLQQEIDKSSLQVLEQTRRLMDYQLSNIDSMSIQLANSDTLAKVMEMRDLDQMKPLIYQIQYHLRDFYINSPYIDSLYVYYKNINMLQSAITGLEPIAHFEQKNILSAFNKMNNEKQWFFSDGINPNKSKNPLTVTLIRPLPLASEHNTGAIIVNLNQQVLFKSPSAELMREGEQIWMLHPKGEYGFDIKRGEPLTAQELKTVHPQLGKEMNNFDDHYRGKNYRFSIITSPHTGWKYIYLVPTKVLYAHTKVNNWFILMLLGISIIISLFFAVIIGKRIYKPIQSLVQMIGAKQNLSEKNLRMSSKREFPFIQSAIEEFSERKDELEQEVQKNLPVMKQNFLTNMLQTKTDNHIEQIRKLRNYGIDFSSEGKYFVSIISIDKYVDFVENYTEIDQDLYRYFIEKISEEILTEKFRVICINNDNSDIVLISNHYKKSNQKLSHESLLQPFETISKQIATHLDITVSIGIGEEVGYIGHIIHSYQEACRSLELRAYKGNGSIIGSWQLASDKNRNDSIFRKRRELEYSMINALKSANFTIILQSLDELFTFIKTFDNYPFSFAQHMILELVTSITHKSSELGLKDKSDEEDLDLYHTITQFDTLVQLENWVTKYMEDLIDVLKAQLTKEDLDISTQIMEYVKKNYHNEISLNGIANELSLDYAYISRLFKQKTGMKFMEYVISLRLAKAKDLLIHSSLSVKDIGKSVGYVNAHSFIRIFKKNEGTTPGKYREKNNPKMLDPKDIY
ncbi:helix-turn-helix domain-containing protein [Gracilibacillus phocaeensis]|uniref:helix-turn-helix domain-containing protein n=1 Tax=Gracilibacillus phocaeensis TaxID=2042304 RepID=UPI0013EF15D6|nr:helix-turn-helix domain-containing protein [Gracilibacillus phocaeensis]